MEYINNEGELYKYIFIVLYKYIKMQTLKTFRICTISRGV